MAQAAGSIRWISSVPGETVPVLKQSVEKRKPYPRKRYDLKNYFSHYQK